MTLLISHIPKTAGSSLRSLVGRHSPDAVWVYEGQLTLANPDRSFIEQFRNLAEPSVVMGHFSYGAHELLGVCPDYVTVMRDPVERVVSLHRYLMQLPDGPFARQFAAGLSIGAFVESGLSEQTNNHACRIIAGVPADGSRVIVDRWLLDRALDNIRSAYRLIGTVDDLGQFLRQLGDLLAWPQVEMPLRNVTSGPACTPSREDLDAIRQKNALDIELYQMARRGDLLTSRGTEAP